MVRTVVLAFAVAALGFASGCGAPSHDGYRSAREKPWKKALAVPFMDGEAEVDGRVDYPARRRARWYKVELPSAGVMRVQLQAEPLDESSDLDLAFEVFDPGFNVLEQADKDSDDAGELTKVRDIDKLPKGTYYVHIYAQGRNDRAEFTLRIIHKSGSAAHKSDFPTRVAYVSDLAAIPLFDDAPPPRRTPRGPKTPRTKKPGTPKPVVKSMRGRISGLSSKGGKTHIRIGRGSRDGVAVGWRGVVTNKAGRAIPNGRFRVEKVSSNESRARVKATQDSVRGAKYVRLTPQ